jgi:uncharacterized protein
MRQLTLTEIWTYPIKSLGGISLKTAQVLEKGLEFDRRWMLVDENNIFLTQRIHPKMALFKLSMSATHLQVRFGDHHAEIPLSGSASNSFKAKIWDDEVGVAEVHPNLSSWFSKHLDLPCKLVRFPENNQRAVDPRFKVNDENVSLADAYPFLIIGQSSLDDLNRKLKTPVPMNRFRPNFVFAGGEPFEEDSWRNFSIGRNRFMGVKQCARCALTTVDQETAQKGIEPLYTLSTYRKLEAKVLFGQNLVAVDHLSVSVGDHITLNKSEKD